VQSVGAYAGAWAGAARMRAAELVLPQRTAAVAGADRALGVQLPRFGRDLDAALCRTRWPGGRSRMLSNASGKSAPACASFAGAGG